MKKYMWAIAIIIFSAAFLGVMIREHIKNREQREQVEAKQRKQVRKAIGHWLYHFSKDVRNGMKEAKDHKP